MSSQFIDTGNGTLEFFSPDRIALAQEVSNHPQLIALLQKHPQSEFEILLAEIAHYCEIVLDGDYTPEDLDGICRACTKRLRKVHSPIILLN